MSPPDVTEKQRTDKRGEKEEGRRRKREKKKKRVDSSGPVKGP